jgi:hypothetical protein
MRMPNLLLLYGVEVIPLRGSVLLTVHGILQSMFSIYYFFHFVEAILGRQSS